MKESEVANLQQICMHTYLFGQTFSFIKIKKFFCVKNINVSIKFVHNYNHGTLGLTCAGKNQKNRLELKVEFTIKNPL